MAMSSYPGLDPRTRPGISRPSIHTGLNTSSGLMPTATLSSSILTSTLATHSSVLNTHASALSPTLFPGSLSTKVEPNKKDSVLPREARLLKVKSDMPDIKNVPKTEKDHQNKHLSGVGKMHMESIQAPSLGLELRFSVNTRAPASSLQSNILSSALVQPGLQGPCGFRGSSSTSSLYSQLLPVTNLNLSARKLSNPLLKSSTVIPMVPLSDHIRKEAHTKPVAARKRKVQPTWLKGQVKPKVAKVMKEKPQRGKTKESLIKVEDEDDFFKSCDIDLPRYHLELDGSRQDEGLQLADFAALEVSRGLDSSENIAKLKLELINGVAGSLIQTPNFKTKLNPVRLALVGLAERVAMFDPEFVLKVALYTRNELNIRATANFMLAYAAHTAECRPYLRRYFSASIRLPSDWIEVAELYQVFDDSTMTFGALPTALRRVMIKKFPEFDKFQLAKYNRDSAGRKKKKAEKGENRPRRGRVAFRSGRPYPPSGLRDGVRSSSEEDSDEEAGGEEAEIHKQKDVPQMMTQLNDKSETGEEIERKTFTLKQLIRKLHITEPVDHVMSLVGKRYPDSPEEFYKSRLPGVWEEERAAKRMKLPVPETWETQVSLKGNKATTWQDLIDHKKLPFMAMLRNLRNMIKAGISEKHHNWVIRKLTDEGAVINSRQFPFRFFSAYQVLKELASAYQDNQSAIVSAAVAATQCPVMRGGRGRGRGRGGRGRGRGRGRPSGTLPSEVPFDLPLLDRYKKALDTAVKIATTYNVTPIHGSSIVFVNISSEMSLSCSSGKGLGAPRQLSEVAALLGLMCKYSCEECQLIVYGNKCVLEGDSSSYVKIGLEKGTILDNMTSVLDLRSMMASVGTHATVPTNVLTDLLINRHQVDNIILLSNGLGDVAEVGVLRNFLSRYRRRVNPNLLFVSVDLSGRNPGIDTNADLSHDNNVHISGFSDQILRYVAERGDAGQLVHVEKIDEAYQLKPMPVLTTRKVQSEIVSPESLLPISDLTPRWRTARVFISSTFRDMHGERDLLTRFVFPELRARAEKHFINVYEVDLRWGVPEAETCSNKTLELCLSEVARCQLFLGILGERYGWVPRKYNVPDSPEFDWVREYPSGASVTELEMYLAALADPGSAQDKAFFYFRDHSFESDVPKRWRDDFMSENAESKHKMTVLKDRIQSSGLEVMNNYPCQWGGVVKGIQPVLTGLDQFGFRVLNNLWHGIQKIFPDEEAVLDEKAHVTSLHDAFIAARSERFIGRQKLIKQCLTKLQDVSRGLLMLVGKAGTGKTALMASLVNQYVESKQCDSGLNVLTHFMGAAPGSTNVVAILQRLSHEMNRRFSLKNIVPQDFKNLVPKFSTMVKEVAAHTSSPLVVFIEGLDLLQEVHQGRNMDWLPNPIPDNCTFVVSVTEGSDPHRALLRCKPDQVIVSGLDLLDKEQVVRHTLAAHGKLLTETPFNSQMKLLTSKKEATIPLYLSLACDELRVFGVFEEVTNKLKSLPQTVPTLLQGIMDRLENDHNPTLVAAALALLVCARNGLMEEELHHLLSIHAVLDSKSNIELKDVVMPDQLLPAAVFTRLRRSICCFLRPTGTTSAGHLSLSHADIQEAIFKRYLKSSVSNLEADYHRILAGYYLRCADIHGASSWAGTNPRAFSELPWHLARGGCYKELEELLCSLHFISASCHLGLATQLLDNFHIKGLTLGAERDLARLRSNERVKTYLTFVSRNIHILSSHPGLTYQQAMNEPSNSVVTRDVEDLMNRGCVRSTGLMKWVNKPDTPDPCALTLSDLSQVVTCVAMSADCAQFACGMKDGTTYLYNTSTGKEQLVFTGHANKITSVCFVGSNRLCTASSDKTLSLWDRSDGHRVAILKAHTRPVSSCRADPRGTLIVSAGWDCQLRVWDAKSGNLVTRDIKADPRPLNCVAFHPEGQLIVTGSWDSTLKIYDIFHKTRKGVLRGHATSVRDVAFSPSGSHIASASLDGEVKLWSSTYGTQVGNLVGHCLPINELTFSPSGNELITVSDDHKVKVWSGHLGRLVHQFAIPEGVAACAVSLHPKEQRVAVGCHDGHVHVFDIISGTIDYSVRHSEKRVNCVKYTSMQADLVVGYDDGALQILEGSTGVLRMWLTGHTKGVMSIALDHSSRFVASGSDDFTTCVHEYPSTLRASKNKNRKEPKVTLTGHTAPVSGCAYSRDGTKLATCSRDKSVMIWAVANFDTPEVIPEHVIHACHADWINCIAWSNTGDYFVTGSNDFNLKLWSASTGTEKAKMVGHMSAITDVNYQYGCIVSTCMDGTVKVWSHKGVEITTLHGHSRAVNGCDMKVVIEEQKENVLEEQGASWADLVEEDIWKKKHDISKLDKSTAKVKATLVASVSDDGTLCLWRPTEGNELTSLIGHSDRVMSVACGSDGTICTSSLDNTVKLWKPRFETDAVVTAHNAEVTAVSFSPNGNYIVTASRDGSIKLWSCLNSDDQGPSSTPVVRCSLKIGDASVNCVCFLEEGDPAKVKFATGSNDGSIQTWSILQSNGRPVLKRGAVEASLPGLVPVSSLVWSRACLGNSSGTARSKGVQPVQGYLIATTSEGDTLYVFSVTKTTMKVTSHTNHQSVLVSGLQGSLYVTAGEDGTVAVWKVDCGVLARVAEPKTVESPYKSDWITALTTGPEGTWFGDAQGQLTVMVGPNSLLKTWATHSDGICGVESRNQLVFTASGDSTVKVWSTPKDLKASDIKQVGQFFLSAPATCLGLSPDVSQHLVVCGDQLGNVAFLDWKM